MRHRPNTAFRRLTIGAAASLALASIGSMSGCNNEGEGERCTFFMGGDAGENGTDECSSGLVCRPTSLYQTNIATMGSGTLGVCCPPPGVASSSAACTAPVGGSTTGGSPTGDGSFDGGVNDASDATREVEAGSKSDAPTEGGADASHDATTTDGNGAKDGTVADATLGG